MTSRPADVRGQQPEIGFRPDFGLSFRCFAGRSARIASRWSALLALLCLTFTWTPSSQAAVDWPAQVRLHLQRHPLALPQDVYKLVYQGVLGAEHAVPQPEAARLALQREMASQQADPTEPLVEAIHPDGHLVRLHLRPFKARGGSEDALLTAFLETAGESSPGPSSLEAVLLQLEQADWTGFPEMSRLKEFDDLMREKGLPAISHSDAFREAYRPAYRIVQRRLLPQLGIALDDPALREPS